MEEEEQSSDQRYERMLQQMGLRHPSREPREIQLNHKGPSTARARLLLTAPAVQARIRDLSLDQDAEPSMASQLRAMLRSTRDEPQQ